MAFKVHKQPILYANRSHCFEHHAFVSHLETASIAAILPGMPPWWQLLLETQLLYLEGARRPPRIFCLMESHCRLTSPIAALVLD